MTAPTLKIKQLQPQVSNRTIAKTLGVDKRTVGRDIGANAPPSPKKLNQISADKMQSGANAPPATAGNPARSRKNMNLVSEPKAPAAGNPALGLAGAAAKQRRYRERVAKHETVIPVRIGPRGIDLLIKLNWLAERDACRRERIGEAIARLISEAEAHLP